MTARPTGVGARAPKLIDQRIRELGDWRGARLAEFRALIHEADPDVVEEWKWRGVPVWEHDGIVCTGESYRAHLKFTFPKGASLPDPARLFNGDTKGGTWRSIDVREGDRIDAPAFRTLFRAAVAANRSRPPKRRR